MDKRLEYCSGRMDLIRFEVHFLFAMLVQSVGMIVVHLLLLKACVEAENAGLVPNLDSSKEGIS